MRKLIRNLLIVALSVGVVLSLSVSPAQAATHKVDGKGKITNDWGDNYHEIGNSLCWGCGESWNTDIVVMWQAILAAEGFLSVHNIDGKFGPGTKTATKKWQYRYSLGVDGYVGDRTWSKADNRLRYGSYAGSSSYSYLRYAAYRTGRDGGKVVFKRYSGGSYSLRYVYDQGGRFKRFTDDDGHGYSASVYFRRLSVMV